MTAIGRAASLVVALLLLFGLAGSAARGERTQHGNLIVSLDGGLSPLSLPRDRPAPVSVVLDGGLRSTDGSTLPRVTRIELGLPGRGVIDDRGLPRCTVRRLRSATPEQAFENCSNALIGTGLIVADVLIPGQDPFRIHADLLAFNGRVDGHRAVLIHAFSSRPPIAVVLPFLIRLRAGRTGTTLVADLPPALGPWPHLARFHMRLARHFRVGGVEHSYLNASCPIPKRFTAGFFSFAKANFVFAGGHRLGTSITRSCRARNP